MSYMNLRKEFQLSLALGVYTEKFGQIWLITDAPVQVLHEAPMELTSFKEGKSYERLVHDKIYILRSTCIIEIFLQFCEHKAKHTVE
jgi:hypothetical protein